MKKLKHLYPAMKNFVYWNTSAAMKSAASCKKSWHEDYDLLLILYSIFVIAKAILLKTQLGLTELIWAIAIVVFLLGGWLGVRSIEEPQINYLGHALIQLLFGMGIPGLYGMFGVILPYYDVLYLGCVVGFLIGLMVLCTYYYVRHCLIWDKFASDSPKQGTGGWIGISAVGSGITTILIAVCARIFQTGGYWIAQILIVALSVFLIGIAVPLSTMNIMRLYYYYRYLRPNEK